MTSEKQGLLPFEYPLSPLKIATDITLFKHYLKHHSGAFIKAIGDIAQIAPFRHMMTPMGYPMSVAMTNCGEYGWVATKKGYSYTSCDPLTHQKWPPMPHFFYEIGNEIASQAGYKNFSPSGCLINCYQNNAHMGLHRDQDEKDLRQPIVSCSFGASAIFVIGRSETMPHQQSLTLEDGDVLVWGGKARLMKHGVRRLKEWKKDAQKPLTRYNITLRCIG